MNFLNNKNNKVVINKKAEYIKPLVLQSISILKSTNHPFHLVDPSPWPFFAAMGTFFFTSGLVLFMHFFDNGYFILRNGFIFIAIVSILWWRDVIRESTFEGNHTSYVRTGLRIGMALFIVSEVMVFASFFWAFFHSSLNPTIDIGCVWPPKGIHPMNAFGIPLLNTLILVTSGAWITKSQFEILSGNRQESIEGLIFTIILAILFTAFQAYEYLNASFNISDGIFGSTFYMATGLHGSHVIVGTIFIIVCLLREIKYHFTSKIHLGIDLASWYWHFVDIVWLFLFIFIYYWGAGRVVDEKSIFSFFDFYFRELNSVVVDGGNSPTLTEATEEKFFEDETDINTFFITLIAFSIFLAFYNSTDLISYFRLILKK